MAWLKYGNRLINIAYCTEISLHLNSDHVHFRPYVFIEHVGDAENSYSELEFDSNEAAQGCFDTIRKIIEEEHNQSIYEIQNIKASRSDI